MKKVTTQNKSTMFNGLLFSDFKVGEFYPTSFDGNIGYEIDSDYISIVKDLTIKVIYNTLNEREEQIRVAFIDSYNEEYLDEDLFNIIFDIQSVLRKNVKKGDDSKRSTFAAFEKGFNASDIYNAKVGMCSEFSLLGQFLLRNLGISSSIILCLNKTKDKARLGRHAMLYLNHQDKPIVFDIFNPVSSNEASLPSVYVSDSTDFDLVETLFTLEGGNVIMHRMPNFNVPGFPKEMKIFTDRYES